MLETPHALVGAAIAVKLGNPALSIPLAFASHFILERVPHWNPHLYTEMKKFGKPTRKSTRIAAIDSVLALTGGSLIAFSQFPNFRMTLAILFSAFAAVLPDVIEAPYLYLGYKKPWLKKYILWQRSIQAEAKPLWGLLTQVLTIAAVLLWLT
jgi:hypothetical protein